MMIKANGQKIYGNWLDGLMKKQIPEDQVAAYLKNKYPKFDEFNVSN